MMVYVVTDHYMLGTQVSAIFAEDAENDAMRHAMLGPFPPNVLRRSMKLWDVRGAAARTVPHVSPAEWFARVGELLRQADPAVLAELAALQNQPEVAEQITAGQ
jgi:hypothetical protein